MDGSGSGILKSGSAKKPGSIRIRNTVKNKYLGKPSLVLQSRAFLVEFYLLKSFVQLLMLKLRIPTFRSQESEPEGISEAWCRLKWTGYATPDLNKYGIFSRQVWRLLDRERPFLPSWRLKLRKGLFIARV